MCTAYLLFGFLYFAGISTPLDLLREVKNGEDRPAARPETLLAVAGWCAMLPLWPVAIVLRAARGLCAWGAGDRQAKHRSPGRERL
jgi:hypothetical protein